MTLRMLMVNLDLGHDNSGLLKIAGDLAERFDAGVVGIAACQLMQSIYNDGYVSGELVDVAQRAAQDDLKDAEAAFRRVVQARLGGGDWRSCVAFDGPADYVAREARCADLILTGASRGAAREVDTGDLVMESGRPVLSIPHGVSALMLEHVVVAWKDTREARRAVAAALPLLKMAGRISVIEMAEADDMEAAHRRVEDVVLWLKRHGADATATVSGANGGDTQAFAIFAKTQGADLVVAGAYGHSRFREWVLGGFTRHLLAETGICALLVH